MALGKESALSRHVTAGGLGSSEFGNSDNSLYASADHPIGRGGIMFSSCPSVRACTGQRYSPTGSPSTSSLVAANLYHRLG